MHIKLITTDAEIKGFLDDFRERVENDVIRNCQFVGEACINIARSVNSYNDQTGNLRNSIGYVVVYDGVVITMATIQANKSAEGESNANEYMNKLAGKCGSGIHLIVVAGMNYASHVTNKGYDVLDSAEMEAEKIMEQLGFSIK